MTLKYLPPSLPLGHQAPHGKWRRGRHLPRLNFFPCWGHKMEVQIWSRLGGVLFFCLPEVSIWSLLKVLCQHGRNPSCTQALATAMTFAVKVGAELHTCLDSQWTPIINAAQNLATGRWTIIVMPKKSLFPSKKKRKGTVATFCQLPWVDPHQLPPIQDRQC